MKDVIKSMFNVSLSIGLYGIQQSTRILTPDGQKQVLRDASEIFDGAAGKATDSLSPGLRKTYEYGEEFQNRIIDGAFGLIGNDSVDPLTWAQKGADLLKDNAHVFTAGSSQAK